MESTRAKGLALIQARDLAAHVDQPIFLVDHEGVLVFFNEAAEDLLGKDFESVGELTRERWVAMWSPQGPTGDHLALNDLPVSIVLRDKRPAHAQIRITTATGDCPLLEVTAIPLLPPGEPFAGALAIFWKAGD